VLPYSYFFILPPPPPSTLFPYTTLFRSSMSRKIGCDCGQNMVMGRRKVEIWYAYGSLRRQIDRHAAARHADHCGHAAHARQNARSEEHTSELQSRGHLVCRLLLEKKKQN